MFSFGSHVRLSSAWFCCVKLGSVLAVGLHSVGLRWVKLGSVLADEAS